MDIKDYFSAKVPSRATQISAGCYASVHELGKKYVLKKIKGTDYGYMLFLNKIMDNPNQHFPKIYDVSSFYSLKYDAYLTLIKMEKLSKKPTTKRSCVRNFPLIDEIYKNIYKKSKILDEKGFKTLKKTKKDKELVAAFNTIFDIKRMNNKNISCIKVNTDLHSNNIMFRNNTPVITDPFIT